MGLDILVVVITFVAVGCAAWPLGRYIARIAEGKRTFLQPVFGPIERGIYWLSGIDADREQDWKQYALSMLIFSVLGLVFTYVVLRLQQYLPLNPEHFKGLSPDLAFNTAVSFATNTNWQNYGGETTLSYFSQMVGLVYHNFVSGAIGIACAFALIRGLVRKSGKTLGNFFVDVVRIVLYILLPIAIVFAIVLISQGVIQNVGGYTVVHTLQGGRQLIAQGPVASQEAIKLLGTNGGGFFNANSGHPFENPNGFTNALEVFSILLIPFSLTVTFGTMVGNIKQGIAIASAMAFILIVGTAVTASAEQGGNPLLVQYGVNQHATSQQSGGNMEGKSVQFGPIQSSLYAVATTMTSTGAVDSAHDSYMPLSGLVLLVGMQLGEVTPGGVGSGLYGILVFSIIAVFIAGLMVGRTPEYLGKKIESREMKLAALAILVLPLSILGFTAISVLTKGGLAGPTNPGPHGFSEILYAFSSATGNNGSAFAGLSGNTMYYNITLAWAMWIGRVLFVVPVLAIAGSLVEKRAVPESAGTFPTDSGMFAALLVGVIIIVGALTFLPALALGPIVEHFQILSGHIG